MFFLKGLTTSHRLIRLIQIGIAVALIAGLHHLWGTSLLQGQQLLKSQTQKMVRLLVKQTAYGAGPALQLQNDEQLQWITSALVRDPKVMSAIIYNETGKRLSFAQSITDKTLDIESPELQSLLNAYPPYVEAILQDDQNLGYIEIRLDPELFLNEIKAAHKFNMEQQQTMLLIAGLIGFLISQALSFKRADFDRRKHKKKLAKATAKTEENNTNQSK